jgi:hypothetical protein
VSLGTVKQQDQVIEHVSPQDAVIPVDQKVSASKAPGQDKHLECHDWSEALDSVKRDQFVSIVGRSAAHRLNRRAGKQNYIRACVHEQGYIESASTVDESWRVTRATGAGGSKDDPSYRFIRARLDDFFDEVRCLFKMSQPRTINARLGNGLDFRNHDENCSSLWQDSTVRKPDVTMFHGALDRQDRHAIAPRRPLV